MTQAAFIVSLLLFKNVNSLNAQTSTTISEINCINNKQTAIEHSTKASHLDFFKQCHFHLAAMTESSGQIALFSEAKGSDCVC